MVELYTHLSMDGAAVDVGVHVDLAVGEAAAVLITTLCYMYYQCLPSDSCCNEHMTIANQFIL